MFHQDSHFSKQYLWGKSDINCTSLSWSWLFCLCSNFKNPRSFLNSVLSPQFETVFINCSFINSAPISIFDPERSLSGSGVYLDYAFRTTFNNCTFKNGVGSAIYATNSNVIFRGNSTFTNNSAAYGGALSLHGTLVVLQNDTYIFFNNNWAKYAGGAIYSSGCFLYSGKSKNISISAIFQNNTANYAGTAIYLAVDASACDLNPLNNTHLMNTQFSQSLVSSVPTGLCFCNDNVLDCDSRVWHIELYPGEMFVVPTT